MAVAATEDSPFFCTQGLPLESRLPSHRLANQLMRQLRLAFQASSGCWADKLSPGKAGPLQGSARPEPSC